MYISLTLNLLKNFNILNKVLKILFNLENTKLQFKIVTQTLANKCHLQPSMILHFIVWEQLRLDCTGTAQEPSTYTINIM